MRVLVPGGCGFLGSNFVRRMAAAGEDVVVLDRLTDFGNLARLEGVPHEFVQGDVADAVTATGAADGCQAIVNFAAETNLDASGLAGGGFIVTDVYGAHVLLEFARVAGIRYVQVSTNEADRPSTSPAASKAGADLQVQAYTQAHGTNASIVRGPSAYGPFQHPAAEPAGAIVRALDEDTAPPGSLEGTWIHADDHSAAVERVLREGRPGEIYVLGVDDLRMPPGEGLADTVDWYRSRRDWWEPLIGLGRTFEEQYARRSGG
ncbi:MAG TPA: NAD-dependent epimerase/dehydratase family protein [Gaiellaceae bacterium]|nr:NAD-dependent epimerase/dehydratase family protein [Gaiellaceae bacterium]